MKLSYAQGKALLYKHNTGDFPVHYWHTVESLFKLGMIVKQGKRIVVTPKGKQYCDEHHLEM